MATSTPLDNRITYGYVNVAAPFFEEWVLPTIGKSATVIYVLPENQPARDLFSFLK